MIQVQIASACQNLNRKVTLSLSCSVCDQSLLQSLTKHAAGLRIVDYQVDAVCMCVHPYFNNQRPDIRGTAR